MFTIEAVREWYAMFSVGIVCLAACWAGLLILVHKLCGSKH
jgi:hypothetical protein